MDGIREEKILLYIKGSVLGMDRKILGRVFMHELMHHVLFTKPPSRPRLIRAKPYLAILFSLLTILIIVVTILYMVSTSFIIIALPLLIASLITLALAERLDVSDKDQVVYALAAYIITRKRLPIKDIEELTKLEWAGEVH